MFASYPVSGSGFPILHRVFTGSPAVRREMIVETFGISFRPVDSQEKVFYGFYLGDDKRRAFGCPITRFVRAFFTIVR